MLKRDLKLRSDAAHVPFSLNSCCIRVIIIVQAYSVQLPRIKYTNELTLPWNFVRFDCHCQHGGLSVMLTTVSKFSSGTGLIEVMLAGVICVWFRALSSRLQTTRQFPNGVKCLWRRTSNLGPKFGSSFSVSLPFDGVSGVPDVSYTILWWFISSGSAWVLRGSTDF